MAEKWRRFIFSNKVIRLLMYHTVVEEGFRIVSVIGIQTEVKVTIGAPIVGTIGLIAIGLITIGTVVGLLVGMGFAVVVIGVVSIIVVAVIGVSIGVVVVIIVVVASLAVNVVGIIGIGATLAPGMIAMAW